MCFMYAGQRKITCNQRQHIKHASFCATLCIQDDSGEKVNTGLSKKMDGIWNRYNLKSTVRIYTFGVLKCSEKFKVLDLP
jgi:hypothetical protein